MKSSLRYSTRQNLPDKVFRYVTIVKVTTSVRNWLSSMLAHLRLYDFSGKTSDHMFPLTSLRSPVFLINSSPFLLLLPRILAHLLPKLQCDFVEFLQQHSFARLFLSIPYLCRFLYRSVAMRSFSRQTCSHHFVIQNGDSSFALAHRTRRGSC
jgi:hypothetical protein